MTSVCILLQNFYDIDIRVRRKAEALVDAGYSVDVYALRGRDGQKKYTLKGVNVYTVSLGKKRGSLARYIFEYLAFFVWCLFRVTTQMPKKRYAVVDVNTLPDFLIFAGVFARWMGAKLVLDMHEITPEFYMSKYGIGESSSLIRMLTFVEKISFKFADHVITINEPITDLLVSRGLDRSKATVITNAADDRQFTSYSKSAAAAQAKSSATFVMMYHGTLTSLYGLDIAIEAFALATADMPGAEFWILGGGPEAGNLKALAQQRGLENKVKLLGMVAPSEIPSWLEQSDVGVLPIRRDVFLEYASPNKLAEYIIMGKPVIISRLRAIQHYFSDKALAFFEPNDAADLARQMVYVFGNPALRHNMPVQARMEYAPIRWEIMKERYLSLMEAIAQPSISNPGKSHVATISKP
jgi:glycosyltransferase involved in cell wall biosynthesis